MAKFNGQKGTNAQDLDASVKEGKSGALRFVNRFQHRLRDNLLVLVSLVILLLIVMIVVFAPYLTPYQPQEQNLFRRLEPPSSDYWFGTDEAGRDIFTRVIYGGRYSLSIGVVAAFGGMIIGSTIGILSGYFGGLFDDLIMRVIDVMMAFPGILLAILIVSILGTGLQNLLIALIFWRIPNFGRITRGCVLSIKEMEYIESARSIGASDLRIMLQHVLINVLSPIIVATTLSVATAILTAAGMGFLGLGVQPPLPEWGAMASTARHYVRDAPHMIIFPGLAIFLSVFTINIIGDALRDVIDPHFMD